MIWKTCSVYGESDTGKTDELGNKIKSEVLLFSGSVRFTPWTDAQKSLEGRTVTDNEQKYAAPVPFDRLKDAVKVDLGGIMHKVTKVSEMSPRWTVLQVKVMKNGK